MVKNGQTRFTKTLAAWQHCCTDILAVSWIWRKFLQMFRLFCYKTPSKFHTVLLSKLHQNIELFVSKFPQKLCSLLKKFHQKFLVNFHRNFLRWKVSTITRFVELFPLNSAFLLNFYKNLPSCNVSTKNLHCRKFFTKNLLFLENVYTNLLCEKNPQNCFVGKIPHKFILLDNLQIILLVGSTY